MANGDKGVEQIGHSDRGIIQLLSGLVFRAKVTTATSSTVFAAARLTGLGDGYFDPDNQAAWEVYCSLDAGNSGVDPQGLYAVISDYVSSTGTFTHTAFASGTLAVGDEVSIVHPSIAQLGMKDDAAAAGAVTTTDTVMAYIKQLVTAEVAKITKVGETQYFEVSVTAAANASDLTIGTAGSGNVVVTAIIVRADAAQTADLTNIAVLGMTSNVFTFIAAADMVQADLDATGKQVAWEGKGSLISGETIIMDFTGTGGTALNLTVTIEFEASSADGATIT